MAGRVLVGGLCHPPETPGCTRDCPSRARGHAREVEIDFSRAGGIEGAWVVVCRPGASLTLCFSACPPPEMIYRHMAVIDGEMVHFEILDTAGQVSSRRLSTA